MPTDAPELIERSTAEPNVARRTPGSPSDASGEDGLSRWRTVFVVILIGACTGPTTLPSEVMRSSTTAPDGALDCPTDLTFTNQASVPEGTTGEATSETALRVFLNRWAVRAGGTVVIVTDARGSLIVEGGEVGTADATPAPAGGWVVLTSRHCESTPRP